MNVENDYQIQKIFQSSNSNFKFLPITALGLYHGYLAFATNKVSVPANYPNSIAMPVIGVLKIGQI